MRKQKQKKYANASLKPSRTITLFHQIVPKANFDALSDDDKYCFLLLGHIHDEISWLQRMAYAAAKDGPSGNHVEDSAQMMQTTFLARLFLGKIFEFNVVLEKNNLLKEFLSTHYDPENPAVGKAKVEEIITNFEQNSWIRTARNKHFLHYPSRSDANEILTSPDIAWEVEIYHGKHSSNTFYPTSDVMANLAWFRLVEPNNPIAGLGIALERLQVIARASLDALEVSIGHFINERLVELSNNRQISIKAPETFADFKLHYFLKM